MSNTSSDPTLILDRLLSGAISQTRPAGHVLMEEGGPSDCLYYLVRGEVSIVKGEIEVLRIGEGGILGEMGILTDQPRSASVVAVTEIEVLRVEGSTFHQVLEIYPALLREMYRDLCGKVQAMTRSQAEGAVMPEFTLDSLARSLPPEARAKLVEQRKGATSQACWNLIGVWGNSSCPELQKYNHCRNCPVFAEGGRNLLEREAPSGYLDLWTKILAESKEGIDTDTTPVIIFRIGREWLAFPTKLFREATEVKTVHRIPHRSNAVLRGLVNVRGELMLCFSLADLVGFEGTEAEGAASRRSYPRMSVVEKEGQRWVLPMDEIMGVYDLPRRTLQQAPVTVAKAGAAYTSGLFDYENRQVALLDDDLVFYNLKKNFL